jgi:DNA repair exonuclease SbcCD ATPase subunit
LAAQLNNGGGGDSFLKKNQSTFLFALAVLSGIFGAYLHSRAEAASSAAAEVEVAMMNRDSAKRYNMCLGAASRWDASLSKALDAANAAVPNTEANGTYQLADAVEKSGEARGQVIHATENQGQVLSTLLDVMEAIPQAKMPKPLKEKLAAARAKLEEVKSTLGDAKNISNDTTDLVVKAKKTLQSGEQEQGPAPTEPKAGSPRDSKGL